MHGVHCTWVSFLLIPKYPTSIIQGIKTSDIFMYVVYCCVSLHPLGHIKHHSNFFF
ncbi:hypothetical protein Hanom_Chr15g01359601 [Helianthus anomalus]